MAKPQIEEQYPLLLFFVGDSRQFTRENKRFFGSGGRFSGITSGASNVITEWPNFISNCWLTTLLCALLLFILSTMFLVTISSSSHHRMPRCINGIHPPDNKTIHLVHASHKWTQSQLDLLGKVSRSFPDYSIHLISIHGKRYAFPPPVFQLRSNAIPKETVSNATTTSASSAAPQQPANNGTVVNLNPSLLLAMLFGNLSVDMDQFISKKFPNVIVNRMSYEDIFRGTPLYFNWPMWNNQMKLFGARTMQLWQYGGLSFDINSNQNNASDQMISSGLERFGKLNATMVSVDEEGFHMEAKIPCHAFFGEVLADLRNLNNKRLKPKQVLRSALNLFCKNNGADVSFC